MPTCPSCRCALRTPGEVFVASDDGVVYCFMICRTCSTNLRKLPVGTRHKHLNASAANVVRQPERYPHRAFDTEMEARLFAGLAGDLVTSAGVVAELLQGDSPSP
jgi:hypothetical protein